MKFKVGDKIKGLKNNGYGVTNERMYLGEVKEVSRGYNDYMEIVVLEHQNPMFIGSTYDVLNSKDKFKIVKSKNGKFFKKLPNNFTGTLEVENGFIVEKEILDDTEKEYLRAVIRPFRNKIVSISKEDCCNEDCFINIELENDALIFPYFKKETMYKGMELEKQYTLKELGLDE